MPLPHSCMTCTPIAPEGTQKVAPTKIPTPFFWLIFSEMCGKTTRMLLMLLSMLLLMLLVLLTFLILRSIAIFCMSAKAFFATRIGLPRASNNCFMHTKQKKISWKDNRNKSSCRYFAFNSRSSNRGNGSGAVVVIVIIVVVVVL